jgi:Kef-type K+ transport system membrane component KefB
VARKIRMVLSISILVGVIGWIVLSYLPTTVISVPQFHWAPDGVVQIFPAILVAGFVAFLLLQVWLVWTTGTSVRKYATVSQESRRHAFRLSVRREMLLTAVPIGFTAIVAAASYGWWQRLLSLP